MELNNIYSKPKYKCAVCGEIYDSILERVNCEQACLKKQEEEAKKIAEQKRMAEKETRKTEVIDALDHASKLLRNYLKDYGYYDFSDNVEIWPSKLWHHFWN